MAQALEKKTISKVDIEIAKPISAQDQVLEVLKPQVLVKAALKNQAKLQSPKKKLLKVFAKIKYNARISEEKVCINKYKGQVDAKLLGVRNYMLNF
ncbi:hypothetical protein ES705_04473 [subsurface metagenome]